jgi:DNA polymerase-3 subunit delta
MCRRAARSASGSPLLLARKVNLDSPQPVQKPIVYIYHGDDPLAIRRHVDALCAELGDPSIADLNITRFDGRQATDDDLRSAANSMPFMTERRLVILTSPFIRLNNDAARKRFITLLDGLPPSTGLVLVVEDTFERRDWKSLPGAHFVRRWVNAAGDRAKYTLCQLPPVKEMAEWVRKEARRLGGQFTPQAAASLVAQVGNDTRMASMEIDKLLLYVDYKRPVEAEDVNELTAQGNQADVFEMVDALASGNSRQAIAMLHKLLEDQEPLSIFGMIVRQFRLLLQAREMLDEGQGAHISGELRLPSFVADKLAAQARRFNLAQLEDLYHRLLLLDETMKTGQAPADLALDTFVAELAR